MINSARVCRALLIHFLVTTAAATRLETAAATTAAATTAAAAAKGIIAFARLSLVDFKYTTHPLSAV
jgi:hypothetical protein